MNREELLPRAESSCAGVVIAMSVRVHPKVVDRRRRGRSGPDSYPLVSERSQQRFNLSQRQLVEHSLALDDNQV